MKKALIKVKPEGRKDVWEVEDIETLKSFIKKKGIKTVHNFVGGGGMIIGADHNVKSVFEDIDSAERVAVFTDGGHNMGHALACIRNNRLECYDIGPVGTDDLDIVKPIEN